MDIIAKRDFVLGATREAFMSIVAQDICKDGIGEQPDVMEIKKIYSFIAKTMEMFHDEQQAYFESYGDENQGTV